MKKLILNTSSINTIRIGLITGLSIVFIQFLNTLLVYHFFRFDIYLSLFAVAFLLIGYFLFPKRTDPVFIPQPENDLKIRLGNLSNRELEIFKLVAEGNTNKEIAAELIVEISTVKHILIICMQNVMQ